MTSDDEIRLSGWACTLATAGPPSLVVPPSSLRLGKLLPRLSRGSWARNTINSLANPREWRRRKIFTPRRRPSHTSYRKPLPYPPVPLRLPCPALSRKDSYPSAFLFGSARTRLFAGQRYLHKSAMQSLFIFHESMARVYTTACMYVNIRVCSLLSIHGLFLRAAGYVSAPNVPKTRRCAHVCGFCRHSWQISESLWNFFTSFITTETRCFWRGRGREMNIKYGLSFMPICVLYLICLF